MPVFIALQEFQIAREASNLENDVATPDGKGAADANHELQAAPRSRKNSQPGSVHLLSGGFDGRMLIVRVRWPIRCGRWMLLELLHREADGPFQLRIVTVAYSFRVQFNLDVGRNTGILGDPFAGWAGYPNIRGR